MKKTIAVALLCYTSSIAIADSYDTFAGINANKGDDTTTIGLEGTYFFSAQESLGPLDQFSYLDDTTNLYASASTKPTLDQGDDAESITLGGEYYFSRFAIGASYSDLEYDTSDLNLSMSYFILDSLKLSVNHLIQERRYRSDSTTTNASLAYDHAINDTDYIGITALVSDDISYKSISGKYFNAFSNGQYLVMNAEYTKDDASSSYSLDGKWYLNKKTGVLLRYASTNEDTYYNSIATNMTSAGVTHFFTPNLVIDAQLSRVKKDNEHYNNIGLSASVQF